MAAVESAASAPEAEPLRFGVLSAANIGNMFCAAVARVPHAVVTSIAARDVERAREFAKRHGVPAWCTYDELIVRTDVDALYIPLPTTIATEWAVRAAQAGKHVLVEKPFASVAHLRRIIDACKAADVAFLDGTHFVHSERMRHVRAAIARIDPGRPRPTRVVSNFSHPCDINRPGEIRADPSLEPAGAIGDLCWYPARVAVALLGAPTCEAIKRVECDAVFHPAHHAVESAVGFVRFASGEALHLDCSLRGPSRQEFEAVTRTGTVVVRDFVVPVASTRIFTDLAPEGKEIPGSGFDVEVNCIAKDDNSIPTLKFPVREHVVEPEPFTQPEAMVVAFCRIVSEPSERDFWAAESLATQQLIDKLFENAMANQSKVEIRAW